MRIRTGDVAALRTHTSPVAKKAGIIRWDVKYLHKAANNHKLVHIHLKLYQWLFKARQKRTKIPVSKRYTIDTSTITAAPRCIDRVHQYNYSLRNHFTKKEAVYPTFINAIDINTFSETLGLEFMWFAPPSNIFTSKLTSQESPFWLWSSEYFGSVV